MNEALDRWIQRATVAAMLALACAVLAAVLIAVGVSLYLP